MKNVSVKKCIKSNSCLNISVCYFYIKKRKQNATYLVMLDY